KPNRYWSHTSHIRCKKPRKDPCKQEAEQYAERSLRLDSPQAAPEKHESRDAEQPYQHSVRPSVRWPGPSARGLGLMSRFMPRRHERLREEVEPLELRVVAFDGHEANQHEQHDRRSQDRPDQRLPLPG